MDTFAITRAEASRLLDECTYKALVQGEPHDLTRDDVEEHWTHYDDAEDAVDALTDADGGWIIDDHGNTRWIAPISDDEFDKALVEVLKEATGADERLLSIPGIYEVVSEFFNNEALEKAKVLRWLETAGNPILHEDRSDA